MGSPGPRQWIGEALIAGLEIAAVTLIAVNVGITDAAVAALLILAVHRRDVLTQALRPLFEWRAQLPLIVFVTGIIWACVLLFLPALELIGLPKPDLSRFAEPLEGNFPALLLTLVWVWIVVAFGEEILGRAFLIDRIEALFGQRPIATPLAVVAAAALFGLAHAYQGAGGMLVTGVIGVILGVTYIKQQRTIWVNVIVHGAVNTTAMVLFYFGVRFV